MNVLDEQQIQFVAGGADGVWYRIGAEVRRWYDGAVSATTDAFCAIDEMDGSLAD
jgi:hypothetical protein